jgi:hypothetical protein
MQKIFINNMHRVWLAGWRFAAVSYRRKPGDGVWVLEFRREHAGEDRGYRPDSCENML